MIYISEFLPNPAGKDTEGEWIEVCATGEGTESLAGWKLQNAKGKTFAFPDRVLEPYGCEAFDYAQTKLTLTNSGGTFYLLNPSGEKTDTATYAGTYKDNVSAMRTHPVSEFFMSSTPTKGALNKLTTPAQKTTDRPTTSYTASVAETSGQKTKEIVQNDGGCGGAFFAGIVTTVVLTAVFWYMFKKLRKQSPSRG
jgi:hypothetical protein